MFLLTYFIDIYYFFIITHLKQEFFCYIVGPCWLSTLNIAVWNCSHEKKKLISCSNHWFPLFYLPDHLDVLLCHLICSSFLLVCFSYKLLKSSFLIGFLNSFRVHYQNSHCVHILFFPNSINVLITNDIE